MTFSAGSVGRPHVLCRVQMAEEIEQRRQHARAKIRHHQRKIVTVI
jgi:hypothetical protein